jgi:membrane associated rhomboid family serine protease
MQGFYKRSSIIEEIKQSFKEGSYLTKLIYINLGVFILLGLNIIILKFSGGSENSVFYLGNWMRLPSYLPNLEKQPWGFITYMFMHEGFLHILFNILILYWFGKIFLVFFDQKKLLSIYLMGGIVGGILFVFLYNLIPYFHDKLLPNQGASGAIMAIVFAIVIFKPDFEIFLMFFGNVKLKYIGLVYFLIDMLSIAGPNAGGHIAHLGGALYGFLYISRYKKGKTIMKWFDRLLDSLFTIFKPRNRKIKVTYKRTADDYEYNAQKVAKQEEVDKILDKISKYGYDSLTKHEKEILFKEGK